MNLRKLAKRVAKLRDEIEDAQNDLLDNMSIEEMDKYCQSDAFFIKEEEINALYGMEDMCEHCVKYFGDRL